MFMGCADFYQKVATQGLITNKSTNLPYTFLLWALRILCDNMDFNWLLKLAMIARFIVS